MSIISNSVFNDEFFSVFGTDSKNSKMKKRRELFSASFSELLCFSLLQQTKPLQKNKKMSDNWIQSKICNTELVYGITVDNIGNIYYTSYDENIYLEQRQ